MADYVNKYKILAKVEGPTGALFLHETLDTERFVRMSKVSRAYNSPATLEAVSIPAGDILAISTDGRIAIRIDGSPTKVFLVESIFVVDSPFTSVEVTVPDGPTTHVTYVSIVKE